MIPYTEALLLCFALLAFWFVRRDRWLLVGVCGCLATLAKQPGVMLVLPLLWEYCRKPDSQIISWKTARVLAALAMLPITYLGFVLYRSVLLGEATLDQPSSLLSSLIVSRQLGETWGTRFGWPWEWAARIIRYIPVATGSFWLELALVASALIILIFALRRASGSARIWSLLQVIMATTLVLATEPLLSLPRRFMLAFPIYIQLGAWSSRSRYRRLFHALGLATMLLFELYRAPKSGHKIGEA